MKNLTGKYKHYCYDWDELEIDETCPEFMVCTCYHGTSAPLIAAEIKSIQDKLQAEEDAKHCEWEGAYI